MKKLILTLLAISAMLTAHAASKYDNPDTIVVARDGTGEFRSVDEAIEVCRAFMDYHKVIYIKKGTYKEKLIIPSWLQNIELCGESKEETIITYDDHANVKITLGTTTPRLQPMGTFRTYTLKIEGSGITLKNLTIENNSARLGQAVSLHTEGDRIKVINCRIIGHQDTIYTGTAGTRLYFEGCYICGTTDFIFGPSTAWFENCTIESLTNSYVTAASTPQDQPFGYVFNNCRLIAGGTAEKCYLGRPWRPYGYTLFMNCDLGGHIRAEGWHNWNNADNEKTARYLEYNNRGAGAKPKERAGWSRQLSKKEAQQITLDNVFSIGSKWDPTAK